MNQKKSIVAVALMIAVAALAGGYVYLNQGTQTSDTGTEQQENSSTVEVTPAEATPTPEELTQPIVISYSYEVENEGETALDILEANTDVEYEEAEFGVFITSISNVDADENHYWAFYVNDEYATKGVTEQELAVGDTITFTLEEIEL